MPTKQPNFFVICRRSPGCENAHCHKPSCDQPDFDNRGDITLGPSGEPVFLIMVAESRMRAHDICAEILPRWINAAVAVGTTMPDLNRGGHRYEITEILHPNSA